jgi:murein tripeptide amidase MpaA
MAVNREQGWFRFRAEGRREAMDRFLVAFPTEAHLVSRRDDRVVVELVAAQRLLEAARSHDLSVSGAVDLTPAVRALLEGVATGNRFANGAVPRGLGVGLGPPDGGNYYNMDEIASACHNLAAANPQLADAVPLQPSWEGQPIQYLHIGTDRTAGRPALIFIGGLHGNEWGGTEILINLAADLLQAYQGPFDLQYGQKQFLAVSVRALLETVDVVILPLANPDGRRFSRAAQQNTADAFWRKNRRPLPNGQVGVDLNRNFDFLFNIAQAFAPGVPLSASTDSSNDVYQGPDVESEIETKNVVSLLDAFPAAICLTDLHCGGGNRIFQNWGDDKWQTTHPGMNFLKPEYDAKRGRGDLAVYGEYMPPGDPATVQGLMGRFIADAGGARGTQFDPTAAFDYQPCAGAAIDYAYARHLTNPPRGTKVYGFGLEWGLFETSWAQLQGIIVDVCAGLVGFSLQAAGVPVQAPSNQGIAPGGGT